MRSVLRKRLGAIGLWILTFLLMVIMCVPGLWVVLTAFRPNSEVLAKPAIWIPENPGFGNFAKIFGFGADQIAIPVTAYFMNSLIIALTSTAIALLIGMSGGYAFARYRFRFKNGIFLGLMLSRTVPGIALSLPIFIIWSKIGLIDAKLGLIIVYVAMNVPFTIWLIDGFFRQIPKEMSEAAQVDGCTRWQAFWKIEFPLAKSGIASAGIFAFLTSWNEYALALMMTNRNAQTAPPFIPSQLGSGMIDWTTIAAGTFIFLFPVAVFTFFLRKHLLRGVTFGAIRK